MDTFRTEDEQVQALKKWWKDNGSSTLISVGLALLVVFGWRTWQAQQQTKMDASSIGYQQLIQAAAAAMTDGDDIKIATAEHLAQSIKEDYSGSGYSHFAALLKAKQAVQDKDFAAAETELRWVLAEQPSAEMRLITEFRLAKVLLAQNDADAALILLSQQNTAAFAPQYAEAKGDILAAQNNYEAALEAYLLAESEAERLNMAVSPVLQTKLGYVKSFM